MSGSVPQCFGTLKGGGPVLRTRSGLFGVPPDVTTTFSPRAPHVGREKTERE